MNLRLLPILSGLALFSSCFPSPDFSFQELEAQLRCPSADKSMAVLLVEKGLHDGATEKSGPVEALGTILRGWRRFPPEGGFLSVDFDKLEKEAADPRSSSMSTDREVLELSRSWSIEKVGLFEDEQGRLCLFQLWSISKPGRLLDWINGNTNKSLLERAAPQDSHGSEFPFLDEKSRERALARARASGSWLRIEDGALVLDLPITRECAAKCLVAIKDDEKIREEYGSLVASSTLDVGEERTLVRYASGASGWIGPWRVDIKSGSDDRLHSTVKASGLPIGSGPNLEEMERILRVRRSLEESPR